ncbi:MAG: hypothetical protein DHS80DRAFT_28652 [Piptocephalis tieghemiana]|nr:MAG: hypothetical protein DHS80DRAFT_28652 [Piptocephalis tieghemiana]
MSLILSFSLGNAYAGEQAYTTAMNRLPVSSHDIFSFDCHPLIAAASSPDGTAFPLLLTVNGVVKYGDDTSPRPFSQHFSLQPDPHKPGNYFVANDCFRFV